MEKIGGSVGGRSLSTLLGKSVEGLSEGCGGELRVGLVEGG